MKSRLMQNLEPDKGMDANPDDLDQLVDNTRPTSRVKTAELIDGPVQSTTVNQIARKVRMLETTSRTEPGASLWPQYSAPYAPDILRYSVELPCDCFRMTWRVQHSPEIIGYNVYRSKQVDQPEVAERVDFIAQPEDQRRGYITWHETTKGEPFYYWVTSMNSAGAESPKVLVQKNKSLGGYSGWVALTNAATVAIDATLGSKFSLTMTQSSTLGNPTDAFDGQQFLFAIVEDSTGGWTLSYDTKYDFGDQGLPTLNTTAKKGSALCFVYWQASDKFWFVGSGTGYVGAL